MSFPRLVIAGTHSGVGKTTVTLALLAAFRALGRTVQPFKVGPDFLDPGHHQLASGRESRNLDGWMLGAVLNRTIFQEAAHGADLSIIEGMMGLFDGSSPVKETGSTAELAHQLNAPILLVVDGSAMARSAAAMVYGYAKFDSSLQVAGVIFNRLNSEGHFLLLKEAVEQETRIPVVGYLRTDSDVTIGDRHLGLRTALENSRNEWYSKLGELASATIDLVRVERLAQASPDMPVTNSGRPAKNSRPVNRSVRVGVAFDPAFCFYYPENLQLLQAAGGELVRFSPMHDAALPDVDLVYLGGGYPEIYADVLQRNMAMRQSIQAFAARGGVVYAECGGLMYLAKTLSDFDGTVYDMVGVIPAETAMSRTQMTLGYRELTVACGGPLGEQGVRIRGHEFHYSTLHPKGDLKFLGHLTDAQGRDRGGDGIAVGNVIALYTHLHFSSHPHVPSALIEAASGETAMRGSKL
ncbi:cobyrinate a,c-diamide synthase [Candidatus Nitrospira allomarina]|jgi:cobyrinic acid a,c-diamide synthase|uniref:Cobyrinate a,c-diamide synthase n=1 Tax=Candidatus Nitrospira allomarina TaxID=3020900 RepID=A0AA96G7B9_9BACT|nr:cobyrinate a,c-diamide synthase [Candidatus Nitrospira allomarina]WNM56724.1 cobyrinate a,c-diamide synthase [Candidatus Nitrospira allomarina]